MSADSSARRARAPRRDIRPAILLCGLFLLLVWPAIFLDGEGTSEAFDHREYHEPVIRTFAEQLPRVDIVNYKSATSPGYHLLMAVISRYVTDETMVLQLISSMFSLGLVLIVHRFANAVVSEWMAMALTMPLLLSPYLLSGAIWLTTDNAAWMFVAIAMGGSIMSTATPRRVIGWSISAGLAVAIRQIHIWVVAPIALAALFQAATPGDGEKQQRGRFTIAWLIGGLAIVAPIAIVGWLVYLWGGLMPPTYVDLHNRGMNPALLPMTLSLIGMFGVFFLPAIGVDAIRAALKRKSVWFAAAFGVVATVAIPTAFSPDDGRWGGAFWQLVRVAPSAADRSLLFVPLAALGCMVLTIMWQAAAKSGRSRNATILVIALACWTAAQMMNSQCWQRYSEPIVLISLAWLTALAAPHSREPHAVQLQRPGRPALLALASLQLLVSVVTVYMPMLGWRLP